MGRFSYGITDLAGLDVRVVTPGIAIEMWQIVESVRRVPARAREFRSVSFVEQCCAAAFVRHGIADPQVVGLRQPPSVKPRRRPAPPEEFIQKVDSLLPAQPWKPGVHVAVAAQLACHPRLVSDAISELVRRGARHGQSGGVVYDASGRVVAVDEERVKKFDPPDGDR